MAECGDESASGLLFFNLTHGTMCFQTREVHRSSFPRPKKKIKRGGKKERNKERTRRRKERLE